MRILGIILIVVGILSLTLGGFTYKKERKTFDVGPIEAHVDEKKTVPIPPIVGGIALAAGVVLVFLPGRSRSGDLRP